MAKLDVWGGCVVLRGFTGLWHCSSSSYCTTTVAVACMAVFLVVCRQNCGSCALWQCSHECVGRPVSPVFHGSVLGVSAELWLVRTKYSM
jgi:hypothetical protein